MTRTKFLTIAVILLLVLNGFLISSMLLYRKRAHNSQGPKAVVIKKLEFDKPQIIEYEKLLAPHKTSLKDLFSQISEKKKDLYQTLKNQNADQSEQGILSEIDSLRNRLEILHLNHFKDIRKICTNESQIEKFNALTDELQKMFDTKRRGPKSKLKL